MTREDIIRELIRKGYKAVEKNKIKNGVVLEGIAILSDRNVAPIIYTEDLIKNAVEQHKSLEAVVSTIVGIFKCSNVLDFDTSIFQNKEYILDNIYIGLQRKSLEDIEKRDICFSGIESYLYIRMDEDKEGFYSAKVVREILEYANISADEAWQNAVSNTNSETVIMPIAKAISEMMGDEYTEDIGGITPFHVISNRSRLKGASAILNKKVLAEFGEKYNVDRVIVLPSSTDEMLLLPYNDELNIDDFSNMVREVNATSVVPTKRLADRAYIISI